MAPRPTASASSPPSSSLSGEKPPPSLTRDELTELPDGSLFWTVTNGVNRMPSFKRLLNAEERWTIISYIRSL